jgi:HEAT repeat protein
MEAIVHKAEFDNDPNRMPLLIRSLSSMDKFERAEAARELCNSGHREALATLLKLCEDPWYQVRIQVPRAMILLGARMSDVAEILRLLSKDSDESVRCYATEARRILIEREKQST